MKKMQRMGLKKPKVLTKKEMSMFLGGQTYTSCWGNPCSNNGAICLYTSGGEFGKCTTSAGRHSEWSWELLTWIHYETSDCFCAYWPH